MADLLDYPPVGFHFRVEIDGLSDVADLRFQSVSGLNTQMQVETLKEGGENRFEHTLPTRAKSSDLVLKRGLIHPKNSGLTRWVKKAIEELDIQPKNLTVKLFGEKDSEPLMVWNVEHAWPKNWKVTDLNAEKSELVIESIELNVNRCILMT